MTVNEIKLALEICNMPANAGCSMCPLYEHKGSCTKELISLTLALINRQQAEIENLRRENEKSFEAIATATVDRHKKWIERRAIKELVERLGAIKKFRSCMSTSVYELSVTMQDIDDIIKEMEAEHNESQNN